MKFLRKWLKRDPKQQSAANDAECPPVCVGVPPEGETEGEYRDDSSFRWFGFDQADSSIFDSDPLTTEELEDKDAVSHKTLDLEGDSLCDAEENTGVDPYNTGRFDTKKT